MTAVATLAIQVRRRRLVPSRRPIPFSRMVKRIADQHGVQAATAWTQAVLRHQAAIDLAALRSAIASKNVANIEAVVAASRLQQTAGRALRQPLTAAAQAAGTRSAAILKSNGLAASFNAVHPNVVNFARAQAAQLVVAVPQETKQVIAEVIALGAQHGLTVVQQARAIREVVGLPPVWASAPLNLRQEIRDGLVSAATSRRLSAVTKQQIRSRIAAGTVTDAFLDDVAETYAASLVNRRALNIARTETLTASHHGLTESWKQAQAQGVLPENARRFWLVTPDDRLSPAHATIPGLNPNGRAMDEPFETTEGRFMYPPSRPNCRCSVGLLPNPPDGFDVTEGAAAEVGAAPVAGAPLAPSEQIQGAIRNRTAAGGGESARFPMPEGGGRALDTWVDAGPVQDGPFYRMLSLSGPEADARRFAVGNEIRIGKGRISDSWSRAADRAPLRGGDVFVRLEARTLRGRDVSRWSIFPEEKEFLSPAQARYRVVESTQVSPGNWRVRVEQIGAEPAPLAPAPGAAPLRSVAPIVEPLAAIEAEAQALYESTYGFIPRRRPMWSQLPAGPVRTRFLQRAEKSLRLRAPESFALPEGTLRPAVRGRSGKIYVGDIHAIAAEEAAAAGDLPTGVALRGYVTRDGSWISDEGAQRLRERLWRQSQLPAPGTRPPRAVRRAVRPTFGEQPEPLQSVVRGELPAPRVAQGSRAPSPDAHKAMVETLREVGVDPRVVQYNGKLGTLKVGGRKGYVVGDYKNGQIRLDPLLGSPDMRQHAAHEAMHLKFDVAARTDPAIRRYVEANFRGLEFDDGVTAYSRDHWNQFMLSRPIRGPTPWYMASIPVEETLAEIQASLSTQAGKAFYGSARYRKLLTMVDDAYARAQARGLALPKGRGGGLRSSVRRLSRAEEAQAKLEQMSALSDYTNHAYEEVNATLRHGGLHRGTPLGASALAQVRLMDAAFQRVEPLKKPLTVYRFMRMPRGIINPATGRPRVGAIFRDKGFSSTSKAENIVRNAAGFDDAVVQIEVPRGMRVIDMNHSFGGGLSVRPVEREVLLPRGSRFRVTGGYGSDDIRVRLIP